jgi:hypothetical protein
MGFRVVEATKAACIRRDRGVGRLRRRATVLFFFFAGTFFFAEDCALEDCATAGRLNGARSAHRTATIKKDLMKIDCLR